MRMIRSSRVIPALLTRMSTLPKASSAALTSISAASGWVTFACTASALRPTASSSVVVCLAASALPRYEKQMSAPCCARRRQIALPMPREPPVTTAALPVRSIMSRSVASATAATGSTSLDRPTSMCAGRGPGVRSVMHFKRDRSGVRARLLAFVGVAVLLGWGQQLTGPAAVSAASCVNGWRLMPATTTIAASPGGAASLAGVPAWWVGRSAAKTPQILRWKNGAWRGVTSPWAMEGSLLGVSAQSSSSAWAVGYLHGLSPKPITARWDGVSWKAVAVPAPAGWTTLTDVVALPDGTAWAVGTRLYQSRDQPVAMRWNGTAWNQASP